jgi:molybdate transport system substrate-binding protein
MLEQIFTPRRNWAAAAWIAAALLMLPGTPIKSADAAELKVLISTALKTSMADLAPRFERASGHKLAATFGSSVSLKQRIDAGEMFDVAILTPDLIDELIKAGKIAPAARVDIARTGIGVAIRAGAPRPDISTVAAFKQTLLAAKSITYGDPTRGGLSSVHFVKVLDRLGIAEAMKPKTRLGSPSEGVRPVAAGEAELGIGQLSEIMLVKGVERLGPIPAELQSYTNLAAGIAVGTQDPTGAKAFIEFLASPASLPVLQAAGMERG